MGSLTCRHALSCSASVYASLRVVCWLVCGLFAVQAQAGNVNKLHRALSSALVEDQIRPDLVLRGLESDSIATRRLATRALGQWHAHVPGATACLRRAVHDTDDSVVLTAVESAARIGSREAFAAVKDIVSQDFEPELKAQIAATLDQRSLRPYWKDADLFSVRDRVGEWIDQSRGLFQHLTTRSESFPPPTRRVIDSGRQAFLQARCNACHRVAGYGRDLGPSLKRIGECYDNQSLFTQIERPSLDIHDAGRTWQVLMSDEQLLVGRIVQPESTRSSEQNRLGVQPITMQTSETTWVDPEEILSRKPSDISAMPTGLLHQLTPTEAVDLIVFLRSDGIVGNEIASDSLHHH